MSQKTVPRPRVWRDANGDGVTNTGELLTLDEAGVASVALQWTDIVGDPAHDLDFGAADTNVLVQQGTFTRTDGTTGLVGDAWFSYDPAEAKAVAPGELDPSVADLPVLWGSGEVLPSPFAMSADPVLREMMQEIAALTPADLHLLSGKVEAFILRWAGVDDANAQGRGPYMSGTYLAAMEKFMGFEFRQIGTEPDPFAWGGSVMTANFKSLQSMVLAEIFAQTPAGWNLIPELSAERGGAVTLSEGTAFATILDRFATNAPADPAEKVGYWNGMALLTHALKDHLPESGEAIAASFTQAMRADGLAFTYDQIRAAFIGGGGDDVLVGTQDYEGTDAFQISRHNLMFGGAGDDLLAGGAGGDTYLFGIGSGHDVIQEPTGGLLHMDSGFNNVVQFLPGIRREDLLFHTEAGPTGKDLVIELVATGETLTIKNQFNATTPIIKEFRFAGEEGAAPDVLPTAELAPDLMPTGDGADVVYALPGHDSVIHGGAGRDALYGNSGADRMDGGADADSLDGGAGNDTLDGDAGRDVLQGGSGNDLLRGGADGDALFGGSGEDRLIGGAGDDLLNGSDDSGWDTYVLNRGDGSDVIQENGGFARLEFGEGIAPEDLRFYPSPESSNHLVIAYTNAPLLGLAA